MLTSSADRTEERTGLIVRGLVAGYGDMRVLNGVDIQAPAGRLTAVVGPNGAGKSTLLKAILGVATVFEGTVTVDGDDITGTPLHELVRRGIGYVPQADDVFDNLRVIENLEMGGYILPPGLRAERIDHVLEIFPVLRAHLSRYVRTMSGGERKMVAVARALMLAPRFILLDEPTAGLSPALTRTVLEEQGRALADHGTGVLLVEQKAKAALELADWAYVLVGGRVATAAHGLDVLADPEMGEVFLGAESLRVADPGLHR